MASTVHSAREPVKFQAEMCAPRQQWHNFFRGNQLLSVWTESTRVNSCLVFKLTTPPWPARVVRGPSGEVTASTFG